eukprot:CAMPEP_0198118754 /NCGR_PEP_ID=MMETSP1442-20131203/22959_1 /TAXON_ID= /ORGANISM="Craspedostauros australis, Strain CCMP3328" /LENGTH=76 /DNA_ID=CAMNT_0043777069 /DNA_START=144 /DNA_END=374 /DNA_ORIENTATION=+
MISGPHQFSSSIISGHVMEYGGVRENGFLPFRFSLRMGELQPYGSLSKGCAAFWASPSDDALRSNPVSADGSTPMK